MNVLGSVQLSAVLKRKRDCKCLEQSHKSDGNNVREATLQVELPTLDKPDDNL